MSPIKSRLTRCMLLSLAVAFFTGCAQEEWRWDWWNKDNEKKQTKPVAASRKPVERAQPAGESPPAETRTASADEPKSADPKADDVERRIRDYTESMDAQDKDPVAYNDFNSKIERQNDPNRHRRISRTAKRASAEPEPSGHGAARVAHPAPRESTPDREADRSVNMNPLPVEPEPMRNSETPAARPATIAERPDSPATESDEPRAEMFTGDTTADNTKPDAGPVETADTAGPDASKSPDTPATNNKDKSEKPAETKPADKPEPPRLKEVRVAAGPQTEPAESAAESAEMPKPNAPQTRTVTVDTFKQKLEEQKKTVADNPNNIAEQLRLRMMYLINNQDDKALALDEGMDVETHAIIQAQIRAMMASREADGRDPATFANNLLESVENLRGLVRAKADLSVPKVILCKSTEGFGVYEPYQPAEFPAGMRQEVLIYVEVDNFSSEVTPNGFFRTLLTLRPSLLNKRTGEEIWSTTYENIEDLSRRRRRDFFLTVSQTIPASLAPGEYVLKVEVEDVLVGKINSNIAEFKMTASAGG